MDTGGGEAATVLFVDDNPGDVRLVEETFDDGHFHNDLYTLTDGRAALEFIHREGDYENAPRPDVALVDLYLPTVDGEDLLHEIKTHPELHDVPVIILTGMDDDYVESKDLDHEAEEDAVLQKPLDLDEFLDVIREFGGFEISIVRTDA
jgi:CheY-like chemotaxis protein